VSTLQHLHNALRALAPAGRTVYDDQAPGTGNAPWVVVGLHVPTSILAMVGTHGGTASWTVTVCGATAGQARVIADECDRAWSGARVDVPGYSLGALVPKGATGPYASGLTALDTDLRYQVVRLTYDVTLSRVPVPA
jgi:hypothetical protein